MLEQQEIREMRTKWLAVQEEVNAMRRREWKLRDDMRKIRTDIESHCLDDQERNVAHKRLADAQAEWSGLSAKVEYLDREVTQMAVNLSVRSREQAGRAVGAASEYDASSASGMPAWAEARETVVSSLPERLTALVRSGEGVRGVGVKAGISPTHITRLMRGQRPGDEPLQALAEAYPEAFRDLAQVLRNAPAPPQTLRRPLASRSRGSMGDQALALVSKMSHYRLDASGRTLRLKDAFGAGIGSLVNAGGQYVVLVEEDWLAPDIKAGDVVFVNPDGLQHRDSLVVVEDGRRQSSLRRQIYGEASNRVVYACNDRKRFQDLAQVDAHVVGVIVGSVRATLLDLPKRSRADHWPDSAPHMSPWQTTASASVERHQPGERQ